MMRIPWSLLALLFLGTAGAHASALLGDSARAAWGYEGKTGPDHWADLGSAFVLCRRGRSQSPVDLVAPRVARLPPLFFHYRANQLSIRNTGRTLEVLYEPGSYILLGSHRYDLEVLRFHTPSEHAMEGRRTAMEIQLFHRDRAGNVAVVAVLVKAGERINNTLYRLVSVLPERAGERYSSRTMGINATFLLPLRRDYLTYEGSLTTPPCTEGVRWIVLDHPLEVPAGFVRHLQAVMGHNARPLQPMHSRVILKERP